MKKILLTLGTITSLTSPIVAVVACSDKELKKEDEFSEGGKITSRLFKTINNDGKTYTYWKQFIFQAFYKGGLSTIEISKRQYELEGGK